MAERERRITSSALEANLPLTRSEVAIPEEDAILVRAVDRYFGVQKVATRLLTEYHHPYRNAGDVIQDLRELCGGMLRYYEGSDQRTACMERLQRIVAGLYDSVGDDDLLRELVGTHLQLLEALAGSPHRQAYVGVLAEAWELLGEVRRRRPAVVVARAALLRRVARKLQEEGDEADTAARLYVALCRLAADRWREWLTADEDETSPVGGDVRRSVIEEVDRVEAPGEGDSSAVDGLEVPSPDELLTGVLARLDAEASPLEHAAILVRLLAEPMLRHRSAELLRQLHFCLVRVCADGATEEVSRAVDLIVRCLREGDGQRKRWLFRSVQSLGEEIARRGDPELMEQFIDRLVATGFEAPGIRGVTETWEVQVNPNHLLCLRTWLSVISADPRRYERLLSALAIQLRFRGLFVSDTDLLQRDVSALLNSGVGESFSLVLQLVRLLPVFYHSVGSEGELREVTTQIDQISRRQDGVVHFLRKQSHAESNNRLVGFTEAIYRWWRTRDPSPLEPHLPPGLLAELAPDYPWLDGSHAVVRDLEERLGLEEGDFATVPVDRVAGALEASSAGDELHRERVLLLFRIHRLIRDKYEFDPDRVATLVADSRQLSREVREAFSRACEGGDPLEIVRAGHRALAEVKTIVLDPEPTEPAENLYRKRHIAAGIPSLYGTYHEPKFDALGLMLRLMAFLKPHLESCVADFATGYMTRFSLARAAELLREMLHGLQMGGARVRGLSDQVRLLEQASERRDVTAEQYRDIVEFISEGLSGVVESNYIAPHERNLGVILEDLLTERGLSGEKLQHEAGKMAEEYIRSTVAATYAIQEMDTFVGKLRVSLRRMIDVLTRETCAAVLSYRSGELLQPIHGSDKVPGGRLAMGAKGAALGELARLGQPVPEGFVVTTELFKLLPAMRHPEVLSHTREQVAAAVESLESAVGLRLGDPDQPLLVSVRSGAAFSMPGMMDTILNVGLTEELAESLARRPAWSWAVWDCYRRYLQSVGMSQGLERDLFDAIMVEFKDRHGVEEKMQFSADQMRDIALRYAELLQEHRVVIHEDPLDQVIQGLFLVLGSWDSEAARIYRRQLGLADDWGTAVIVQRMVYGNLGETAGTGVAFTHDPRSASTGVELFGDFTPCSQGEDVVAGLVHPYPVSERQRLIRGAKHDRSLETMFPETYRRLTEIARELVLEHGFEHQELEFTFESPDPGDLYLLQVRPLRLRRQERAVVFAQPEGMAGRRLTSGTGASGGALSGAVAITAADVQRLRSEDGSRPIILLRPDMVPEDIELVLQVDGVLTARGGATSHAAITAKRLGKVCIVNCRDLVVSEREGRAKIREHEFRAGDQIAIDGFLGDVYAGAHEVTTSTVPRRGSMGGAP